MSFTVTSIARAQPDRVLTNAELETRLDTTDQWIRDRTGIVERRVGGSTSGLAVEAGAAALERAGLDASDVDLLLVATSTPQRRFPGAGAEVAEQLGITGGTFDLNAACAGFVYGFVSAAGWLATGVETVLYIGSDAMSTVVDPEDRGTAILFGDGAGALVLRRGGAGEVLGVHTGTDGTLQEILYCDRDGWLTMEGQAVFKVAVRSAVESAKIALDRADLKPGDIDLFVPHQANQRITDAIAQRLGLDSSQVVSTLALTGNSSAGTIPHALSVATDDGRLGDGSLVLMSGFGAGMTWATAVVRWAT